MAHRVKCFYCGEMFDADKEPFEKPQAKRYAHKSCYDKNHNPDDDFISKIYELVKLKFGEDYSYTTIDRQRKSFIEKYGYTNEGIYQALKFHFDIKKGNVMACQGRIGIVPYVYDEAQEYERKIKTKNTQLSTAFKTEYEHRTVDMSKISEGINGAGKKRQSMAIDMDLLRKEMLDNQ